MSDSMKTWTTKDKSGWGEGPWQTEPDKAQWYDEATGLPCLIVRNNGGALCGYVGVPKDHPMHGNDYDGEAMDDANDVAHGGLTFAAPCADHVCHIPERGEGTVWWFGFDCAHSGDLCPAYQRHMDRDWGETYKPFAYVQGTVTNLAAVIAKVGREP